MSKLDAAAQQLLAVLSRPIPRRNESMSDVRIRELVLDNRVDHTSTAGMVTDTKNQLEASMGEWQDNIATLQEEIDRLQDLVGKAETAITALNDIEDDI